MNIVVHTKTDCPFCDQVKAFLNAIPLPFTTVVHDDLNERNNFYDTLTSGDRFVPQILITDDEDNHEISGFTALYISGIASLKGLING